MIAGRRAPVSVEASLGAGGHPMGHGVMVDPGQLAGVSIRLGQVESFKNEHDLLGRLHVLLLDGWVVEHAQFIQGEPPGGGSLGGQQVRYWGDLLAASGGFSWPPGPVLGSVARAAKWRPQKCRESLKSALSTSSAPSCGPVAPPAS